MLRDRCVLSPVCIVNCHLHSPGENVWACDSLILRVQRYNHGSAADTDGTGFGKGLLLAV